MSQKLLTPEANRDKKQIEIDASTKEKSCSFVKRMIALSISNVLYLRGIFNDEAYCDKYIEDFNVKIIRKTKDKNVQLLINWLEGCFEAVENKYLRQLILCIGNAQRPRNEVLETYSFTIKYDQGRLGSFSIARNGQSVNNFSNPANLKEQAYDCISNLIQVVQSLDSPPDEVSLDMELSYYDRTPADYEPRGFRPTSKSIISLPNKVEIGKIRTNFHNINIKLRTFNSSSGSSTNAVVAAENLAPTRRPLQTLEPPDKLLTPEDSRRQNSESTAIALPSFQSMSKLSDLSNVKDKVRTVLGTRRLQVELGVTKAKEAIVEQDEGERESNEEERDGTGENARVGADANVEIESKETENVVYGVAERTRSRKRKSKSSSSPVKKLKKK